MIFNAPQFLLLEPMDVAQPVMTQDALRIELDVAELGAHVALHDLSWDAPAKYNEAANLGEVAKAIASVGGRTGHHARQPGRGEADEKRHRG
jgi:hypothetical protein